MRAAHAEKKRERAEAKRFLRELEPVARVAALATAPGAEALVILPGGKMAHFLHEASGRYRLRAVEDMDAATAIAERWHDDDKAAESVQ